MLTNDADHSTIRVLTCSQGSGRRPGVDEAKDYDSRLCFAPIGQQDGDNTAHRCMLAVNVENTISVPLLLVLNTATGSCKAPV
jgi:hypothetical protein